MRYITTLVFGFIALTGSAFADNFIDNDKVKLFIQYMADKHKYDKNELNKNFQAIEHNPKVLKLMQRQAESLNWGQYKRLLVTKKMINNGAKFYRKYEHDLAKIEAEFKVPAGIVVAIIGMESKYGRDRGAYPVFQTLATLAFHYPRRSKFFQNELEQYLLLTKEDKLDVLGTKGSYAGAMGISQFMPSSYRAYAVDISSLGRIDLFNSTSNAMASTANYLAKHGWHKNEAVALRAKIAKQNVSIDKLFTKDRKSPELRLNFADLKAAGVEIKDKVNVSGKAKCALMELCNKVDREYWVGMKNFYVLTRYNRSSLYAMAALQISEEIKNKLALNAIN